MSDRVKEAIGATLRVLAAGEPVQLREPVQAKVWVRGADGKMAPGEVTLPAGWWCLPDPDGD